ncbi:HET-domain-containing protein [Gymnopus androsaceus JB14]|uniref:HET-domain-containing protein n=1 Tax=Gymnopus androsaceus JB14 TaxID=1447944 RepID=A0A6A4HCV3_9AGAR|nr:HET-domain-containing protein [Gymnopus androsaceus JB14]
MEGTQASSNHLVCDRCWNGIFSVSGWQTVLAAKQIPGRALYSKGYSYQTTWEAICAAADHCTWCRFLRVTAPNLKGEVEVRAACDEESDCTPAGERRLSIAMAGSHGGHGSQYYMYTSENDNAARFVAARERIRDVTAPESYKLALQCVENCVNHHYTKCPKPQENTFLPDRVIDCTDTRKPKLILTRGQRGHYVVLSYVWGAKQPMMTTTLNIEKYCTEGLDMAQFPQTIQDAVIVTHNLGQRYLWIDAQCILQDCETDKVRQLGMMHTIYRNSYLSISAACANAATQGFLHWDRPQKVPNARIPYRCPDGTVGMVWIAKRMDTDIPDASHSYWDELEPVSYRGWCLQERMLPARSLIYASDTLKYYCQTETVNIGGALCEPSTGMRLPNVIYQPQDIPFSDEDHKTYRQAWLAVLFVYTLRAISKPADKLVALAGLAEQFQMVYHDEYLAGLWQKTLLFDLLWRSESGGGACTRPKEYRAPSWSWAAVDGLKSVWYIEESLSPDVEHVEIVDCKVTLKDHKVPFGEVTAGFLKVMGYLKEITLESNGIVRVKIEGGQEEVKIGHALSDAKEEWSEKTYVVPLLWSASTASVKGLIVVRAADGHYQRVGHFTGSDSKDIKWLAELNQQEITIV